jgi:lysozyme
MIDLPALYTILEKRLRNHEGMRLKPYKDSKGLWTIGVGRCLETKGISKEEASYLLKNDMEEAVLRVVRGFPWSSDLGEDRFSVLVEMAFQMGMGGLLTFEKFLDHLEAGRYEEAANEMLDSKWAKEDSPKRALELSDIIRGTKYGT